MAKRVTSPKRVINPNPKKTRKVKRPNPNGMKKLFPIHKIIEALRKNNGRIYLAAKALGCAAGLIRKRRNEHESIRIAIQESRGQALDLAENQLLKAIKRGEAWAITLALKTLGKNRGYVEGTKANQTTVNVNNAAPVQTIDYDSMPLETRLILLAEWNRQQEQQKLLAPPSQQTIEAEGTVIEEDD